jgi:hypothetical protein
MGVVLMVVALVLGIGTPQPASTTSEARSAGVIVQGVSGRAAAAAVGRHGGRIVRDLPIVRRARGQGAMRLDRGSLDVTVGDGPGRERLNGERTAQKKAWDGAEYRRRSSWDSSRWYGSQWASSRWYSSRWYGSDFSSSRWYSTRWYGSRWYATAWE